MDGGRVVAGHVCLQFFALLAEGEAAELRVASVVCDFAIGAVADFIPECLLGGDDGGVPEGVFVCACKIKIKPLVLVKHDIAREFAAVVFCVALDFLFEAENCVAALVFW